MDFRVVVELTCPLEHSWAVFTDPSRLRDWQITLRHFEPVSGTPGAVGSVTRFTYHEGGRDVVMTETITECLAPTLLAQRLEASMMSSTMRNTFARSRSGGTTWTLEGRITFRGIWKLMQLLGPRMFAGKTETDMQRFKSVAESAFAGRSQ